jgi:hypothetical protein
MRHPCARGLPLARWATVELYAAVSFESDLIRRVHPDAGPGRLAYLAVELRE